jgi:hypothetical protein
VFILIVGKVAGSAVVLIYRAEQDARTVRGMAARTRQRLKRCYQDKSAGDGRVVELLPVPASLPVTDGAVLRISGARVLSLIVTLVAGHTVLRARGLETYSAPRDVTCSTLGPLMCPLELETP